VLGCSRVRLQLTVVVQILEVCYKSGVTHVTIYAFSIENFKRSKYEVDALMDMAKIKLRQLVEHGELLDRYGARVRILGQRELIKPDVLEAVDQAVEMTSRNGNCFLNVCFPYTSREEITTAIRSTVKEYSEPIAPPTQKERRNPFQEERIANTIRSQHIHSKAQQLQPTSLPAAPLQSPSSSTTSLSSYSQDHSEHDTSSLSTSTTLHPDYPCHSDSSPPSEVSIHLKPSVIDNEIPISSPSPVYPSPELITPAILTEHMYTASDPPIDLLIRTSGVRRLSDFMLWQCHQDTEIVFLDVLWPEFDLWSFLPAVWKWQWRVLKERKATEDELNSSRSNKSAKLGPARAGRRTREGGFSSSVTVHAD